MSMFGFYHVVCVLRHAGWPRKLGFLKGDGYDTLIADQAIIQMLNWGAGLGAGRPDRSVQILAEIFKNSQEGDMGALMLSGMEACQASWNASPDGGPSQIAKAPQLAKAFGKTMTVKDFQDERLRKSLEILFIEVLLWGLANPQRFATWYQADQAATESRREFYQKAGLEIGTPPTLSEFFENCDAILVDYESDIGVLPLAPAQLTSAVQGLRCPIGK